MSNQTLNILDFSQGSIRTLHLTWFAFFLSFVLWFNMAPLGPLLMDSFNLTDDQWKALAVLNLALTIPARIVIGILVDQFGPRRVFSTLLITAGLVTLVFALAQTFQQLAILRFLMGFVGAGFVIGIRMVGEWFPARQVGLAEGIYGGWGNFGSAAAAFTLPTIALLFGGDEGWRYAVALTGVIAILYGLLFYRLARDTPKGSTYFKPKRAGGLEVSTRADLLFYMLMNIPMYLVLGVLAWKLSPADIGLLSQTLTLSLYGVLVVMFVVQFWQIMKVNQDMLRDGTPEHDRYRFKQVAILGWAYFATFGSELAVVSMLPIFFYQTFEGVSLAMAGMLGGAFAFMNLVARPSGGWFSDRFGRRKTLTITIFGLAIGYFVLATVDSQWLLALAVLAVMSCSFFVQAGEGAVFAMVPLIKRRMTGQIAGLTGAYGNVGAVTFGTFYLFVDASAFFLFIGLCALVVLVLVQFLDEPRGHMTETLPDGTVQMIEVS
ncbi:NarK family nitrate/nitrite MFS transporter [Natronospirillum operosum]|uniref:Nitrate/nitrite transporter n=1 Tax=Natronospirillum operosum TaxID=2759953 RepID=A0A4Z0WCS3_9GAMM|nr:NarK family nitrate/nitrite MFS transporter [Natronospirillum operosum]TGG95654.1 NarK family nitrate/nitrite MFS transporter [Natronospirillum operosum]